MTLKQKEERINFLWKKREILLEKVFLFNNMQSNVFRLKNYQPHITRNTVKLNEVNEELYKLTGIDKRQIAL